ncbi:MAG: GNAT family N-acetyltransferase [Halanaerobiales bacterium]
MRRVKYSELTKIVEMKLLMFKEAGENEGLVSNAKKRILDCYRDLYQNNKARHFCIEKDEKIVACAGGFIKDEIPFCFFEPTFYGFIGDVYTEPEYRGQGLATKLTERVIGWLENKHVKEIRLFASEEAESIYKKMGFRVIDEMFLELD